MQTEDDIKRAFLPYLKEFYRYRYEYRPDSVHTELDNVSAGGLVADGMLSFRKDDGSPFVCTYEATSVDKSEEVKFSLNVVYFTWDCLAFGAVVAAVAYGAAFALRLPWLLGLQWAGNLGFVLGMGLIGFFAWYFSMRGWRKYRYIYAIEQFKRYFADEQWIALAEDVFPVPTDQYLLELKNQCVYNGFGLVLISYKGSVRALVTPSRLGIYGKDRRMVQWVTQRDWYQAMSGNVGALTRYRSALPDDLTQAWNKLIRPVRYLFFDPLKKALWNAFTRPLGSADSTFDRYMTGQSVQKWVFALALTAIIPLGYRVLTIRADDVRDVVERPDDNPEDRYGYLYEGDRPPADPRGIPKQYPEPVQVKPPENVQEEIQTINLSGDDEPEPATSAEDPCAPYRNKKGWFLEDNAFVNKGLADERVSALLRMGIESAVLPKKCIGDGAGYIVRVGDLYAKESEAARQAAAFGKEMERNGLYQGDLAVRRLD
ncbi:MAG: SPOR domain-containing protein [Saprospiraceae bacterium]